MVGSYRRNDHPENEVINNIAPIVPAGALINRIDNASDDSRPRVIRSQRASSSSFGGWGPRI